MAVKYYIVKNRSASRVCYNIPEDHIRRTFAPGESKQISYNELMKLSYQPGGRELMTAFLQIQSTEAIQKLNIPTQPEYYMSEAQVIDLLKTGTLEEFLDCLDFAPTGVMELIQKHAVGLPLADYAKKKALKDKTGFDVDAIVNNIESERSDTNATETTTASAVSKVPAGRRTAPKYNVVSKAAEN